MITPLFTASQDDSFVILNIRLKYIKVAEIEYLVATNSFTIFSKPYYLRLEFQEELDEEEGKHRASYDYEEGMLTVMLPKLTAGTYFHNLDIQTALLGRKSKKTVQDGPTLIEDLAQQVEEEDFDWDWQQEYPGKSPTKEGSSILPFWSMPVVSFLTVKHNPPSKASQARLQLALWRAVAGTSTASMTCSQT